MVGLNFTINFDHMDNLEKRIKALAKSTAFVGYTAASGIHEDSGTSYTNLMYLMSVGYSPKNLPARPLLLYAANDYSFSDSTMKRDLTKYLSNIDKSIAPISVTDISKNWVAGYAIVALRMFGSTTIFAENAQRTINQKGFNAPLVDTGELRDHLGYIINGSTITPVKGIG